MSRFMVALCVVLITLAPRAALSLAELPDHFQRPDCHRYAINAIIGDLSFVYYFGTLPTADTDPDLRVRAHLSFVHELLSHRDVSDMPAELRRARQLNLDRFRDYIEAGTYPRNHLYDDQIRPCFIDRDDRICAVGYLVEQSAGRDVAEKINDEFQSEFLWQMKLPGLDEWIESSGFSLLELSLVQPGYAPEFHITVTQHAGIAPAMVSTTGYVTDYGGSCHMKFLVIDFGDGTLWSSREYPEGANYIRADLEHLFDAPGEYTITGAAVSSDWCGNQVATETLSVSLAPPVFSVSAVQTGEGPPYGVYLQTDDDIRLPHLRQAMVDWGDGAPAEAAGWYAAGSVYRTSEHDYANEGSRNIVVENCYSPAPCTYKETASVEVDVGSVPTEVSSWGRIRALYARGR